MGRPGPTGRTDKTGKGAEAVEWREDFRVGVEEIDEQHQRLFAMLDRLDRAVAGGEAPDDLVVIVDGLIAYLKEHFGCEENLLGSHPRWPEHHRLHWQFTEQTLRFLRDFQRASDADCLRLATEIRDFLGHWLQDHILQTDRRFFAELPAR